MIAVEKNLSICRGCNKIKMRIQDGQYNSKDKRYVDETGAPWTGRKCPQCIRETAKTRMKKKRSIGE